MSRTLLLLPVTVILAFGQDALPGFGTGSRPEDWESRRAAFRKLCPGNTACVPRAEACPELIDLLVRESANPFWGSLAEGTEFEDYYGALVESVQNIAASGETTFRAEDRTRAFAALVNANYNPDSSFALWLSVQPGARPAILQSVESQYPVIRILKDPASIALLDRIAQSDPNPDIRRYATICLSHSR